MKIPWRDRDVLISIGGMRDTSEIDPKPILDPLKLYMQNLSSLPKPLRREGVEAGFCAPSVTPKLLIKAILKYN